MNYHVIGGKELSGSVRTNTSKNAAVVLLAASLLNRGTTTLKRMPKIEEVKRLIEVMRSIGMEIEWNDDEMKIVPPKTYELSKIDKVAAQKTRSIALFIAPLAHMMNAFYLPAPAGCDLGKRSLGAHIDALERLGISISGDEETNSYRTEVRDKQAAEIIMYEASDTGTENVLMAAAKIPGRTVIKFASANYMVQDLCFFLEKCGIKIEGIGTTTLVVHGVEDIDLELEMSPGEDPIESMFFISLALTTGSKLTIERCAIDFLELELATLEHMGMQHERSKKYFAENGRTELVDITIQKSELHQPGEKIAPRPYPGINIDNLPYFVSIATQAKGETLIHDWVYEIRSSYYLEMSKLGADVKKLDQHRVLVKGPTTLHGANIKAPPAFRPASILLIGMLAAEGESTLYDVYPINRGYENLHERLTKLGANIEAID